MGVYNIRNDTDVDMGLSRFQKYWIPDAKKSLTWKLG